MAFDSEGPVAVLDRIGPAIPSDDFYPEPRAQPSAPSVLKAARTAARCTYKYVLRPILPWIFDWALTRAVRAVRSARAARAARAQRASAATRRSTFRWRLARLLIASSKHHAF